MERAITAVRRKHPLWLLSGFWICVVIAIAVVARRLSEFIRPGQGRPPRMAVFDAAFSSHALLTSVHMIPAAIFVALAVWVLLGHLPEFVARLFFLTGAITGVTAYLMSYYAIGGWVERSAVFVFDTWFLVSLSRAYWLHLRGDAPREREWTTRAVGILLGIATTRPVVGVFFASSSRTHLSPRQFFGIAFWIGFLINVVVVELWLHSKQRANILTLSKELTEPQPSGSGIYT